MQIYSHYLSLAQALNASNYPANMEFHLIPPSIHPTEFGGNGGNGAKSGFGLFPVHAPAPVGNAQGGYDDGRWNTDMSALIIIGSACSSTPLVIEAINAPLSFALRV